MSASMSVRSDELSPHSFAAGEHAADAGSRAATEDMRFWLLKSRRHSVRDHDNGTRGSIAESRNLQLLHGRDFLALFQLFALFALREAIDLALCA
jgi:hypothetical protein